MIKQKLITLFLFVFVSTFIGSDKGLEKYKTFFDKWKY